MVIDSSAICSVFLQQEGYGVVLSVLKAAREPLSMSAVNAYEAAVVLLARKGPEAVDHMYVFLQKLGVEIIAFDAADAVAAYQAYRRFGKGFHPAGLNFADCAAYVAAIGPPGQSLLFTGADFSQTDIESAL